MYKTEYDMDLINISAGDVNKLSEFVSENIEKEISIPWKITAIISQVIDFLRENKESIK